MSLRVCPGCSRHVRSDDGGCPFCKTSRLAILGGALAVTAGCMSMPVVQPLYGAIAPAASPTPVASPTASPPVAQPLYGAMAPLSRPET